MTLTRGDCGIEIEMHDTFGKRPGLYVQNGNQLLKVGNFASEEKARIFEDFLRHLCGFPIAAPLWDGGERDVQTY